MPQLDEVLIEEAKQDATAFGELVQRYQDRLYNFLYRMTGNREDAQDLAQETFLRVYRALHRFRQGAPFKPWLYRIAINLAVNHRRSRRPTALLDDEYPSPSGFSSPEVSAEMHEVQRQIRAALMELPEHYRAAILLRHVDELSYEEMAQAQDLPLGTAKVRLHRARLLLQEKLRAAGIRLSTHELQSHTETPSTVS